MKSSQSRRDLLPWVFGCLQLHQPEERARDNKTYSGRVSDYHQNLVNLDAYDGDSITDPIQIEGVAAEI